MSCKKLYKIHVYTVEQRLRCTHSLPDYIPLSYYAVRFVVSNSQSSRLISVILMTPVLKLPDRKPF